jgi:hypothetical protein
MFAGPNGSGKSTLKPLLAPAQLGVYLNPDEIEAGIRRDGFLDFSAFGVTPAATSFSLFLRHPALAKKPGCRMSRSFPSPPTGSFSPQG